MKANLYPIPHPHLSIPTERLLSFERWIRDNGYESMFVPREEKEIADILFQYIKSNSVSDVQFCFERVGDYQYYLGFEDEDGFVSSYGPSISMTVPLWDFILERYLMEQKWPCLGTINPFPVLE